MATNERAFAQPETQPESGLGTPTVPILRPSTLPAGCQWMEVETPYQTIGFLLRTSRRKTIGLTINDDGLLITKPVWVPRARLHQVVGEKAPWILHKLHLWHERRTKHDKAEEQWRVGGHFPYLGVPVTIAADSASPSMEFSGELYAPAREDRLSLPLSVVQSSERLQGKVYQWLHDRAKAYFAVRLDHFCALAGSEIKSWRLAAPKARWGSCSSDRRIMLNWRLIHFPVNVVDYVVAHEVAHLRHMNHGPQFWQEVARLYPDYKQARGALRSHHPGSMPLF